MPTPSIFCTDDPSAYIIQRVGSSWFSSSSGIVNFAMKSTSTWAFMAIRGLAELGSLLYHSFCGLEFVHHLLDGLVHYYD